MKYDVDQIEDYLNVIPADRREILLHLIAMVKEYFPNIKGDMKYNMPTFEPVCALASQKHYVSFYIHRTDLVEKYREELGELKVGKSCIRFKRLEQLPDMAIRKIFEEIKEDA